MDSTMGNVCLYSAGVALDDFFEEKVEFDIVIPDYSPAAAKILGCDVNPVLLSKSAEGDRVNIDVQCKACVIYQDETDDCIRSVKKTETFSRSFPLGKELEICRVKTGVRPISINCRMVNSRRLSVKAVIGTAIKVIGNTRIDTSERGDGIEAVYENTFANVFTGSGDVNARVIGSIAGEAGITDIINTTGSIIVSEIKPISGKLIIKADAVVGVVYMTGEGTDEFHFAECVIPFSEVIDIENADENSIGEVSADVTDIRVDVADDSGRMDIELEALLCASVYSSVNVSVMSDAYSVKGKANVTKKDLAVESLFEHSHFSETVTGSVPSDIPEARIIGVSADPVIKSISLRDGTLCIDGDMYAKIYMCNSGEYKISDKSVPFSFTRPLQMADCNMRCEASALLKNISFNMPDDDTVTLTATVDVALNCFSTQMYSAVVAVDVDEECQNNCKGIILYYADKDEKLWDIAKKYRTSVGVVKRDNNIDEDVLSSSRMLLISFK